MRSTESFMNVPALQLLKQTILAALQSGVSNAKRSEQ